VPHWSIEFSPESHDQAVRNTQEGEADYSTAAMEAMIAEARARRGRLEATLARGGDPDADADLRGEIARYSMSTVCDKRELFWRGGLSKFRIAETLRIMARYFVGRGSR
jgi:hypothetical protein